jgi:hypothetical protein
MWAGAQVRVDRFTKDLVGDAAAQAVPGPSDLGPDGLRLGGGWSGVRAAFIGFSIRWRWGNYQEAGSVSSVTDW